MEPPPPHLNCLRFSTVSFGGGRWFRGAGIAALGTARADASEAAGGEAEPSTVTLRRERRAAGHLGHPHGSAAAGRKAAGTAAASWLLAALNTNDKMHPAKDRWALWRMCPWTCLAACVATTRRLGRDHPQSAARRWPGPSQPGSVHCGMVLYNAPSPLRAVQFRASVPCYRLRLAHRRPTAHGNVTDRAATTKAARWRCCRPARSEPVWFSATSKIANGSCIASNVTPALLYRRRSTRRRRLPIDGSQSRTTAARPSMHSLGSGVSSDTNDVIPTCIVTIRRLKRVLG